ncbi:MAG: MFS transporter [Bryobacteraceae bacterium]
MPAPSSQPGARVAFEYANFRWYLAARFLVNISSEMQSVAVGWQIYGITHRPLDLGLVGLAQFLPGILLFLVTGHTADRYPRHRILQACYGTFPVTSALLVAFTIGRISSPYPIYLALLWNGTVRAFAGPASQAFLPLLVDREHFSNAVAWSSSTFQTATILGPVVGGVLYGFTGTPIPVYLCAGAAYIAAVSFMLQLRMNTKEHPPSAPSPAIVFEGLRFIWRNKLILGAMSLDLFAVLLGGAVALLPVYAREILGAGASTLGLLRSAPGVGAVLMAIAQAHFPLRRHEGKAMLACVAAFGACIVVFGLSRNLPLSLAALALAGAFDMVSVIIRHTLIQLRTPDEMRGRVSAVNTVFIGASNEVGQFESGLTAQWFGTVPAVVLGGAATLAVVALWTRLFPALRRVDRLQHEPFLADIPETAQP